MTIMNTELYEALIEAGASDKKARAAANVVEEQNRRFDGIDQSISDLRKDMEHGLEQAAAERKAGFDKIASEFRNVDSEFKMVRQSIEHIRFDIKHSQDQLFLRLGGLIVAVVGLMTAILKMG